MTKTIAFGTSALREVSDRNSFLRAIKSRTGIDVQVISGNEEAKLIALGILANERTPKGRFALIDIGGGSTEICVCRGKRVLHSCSFPLGTARLQQVFLKRSPPSAESVEKLRSHIRSTLQQVFHSEKWPRVGSSLASSGTARTLVKMLRKGSKSAAVDREKLSLLVDRMADLGVTELLMLPRMEPKRVDMILGGAILLEEVLKALGARKVAITEYSLRDGILEEEIQLFRSGTTSHLVLHLDEIVEKAETFGQNARHIKHVAKLGDELFDELQSVHRLPPAWKVYLHSALLLRNIGESIGRLGHAAHSAYIVRNGDLPPLEEWEIELLCALCLRHGDYKKLDDREIPFSGPKRRAFKRLLGLLQLTDALDSGPEARLALTRVQRRTREIRIWVGGRGLTGLEQMAVERRQAAISSALGKTIVLERR